MNREERAQRVLRLVASDDEQEEAERILQTAAYRRAIFLGYCASGFSEREAFALVRAELGAPVVHIDREGEQST